MSIRTAYFVHSVRFIAQQVARALREGWLITDEDKPELRALANDLRGIVAEIEFAVDRQEAA